MISDGVDFHHKSPSASGLLFFSSSDTLGFPVNSQNVTNLSYLTVPLLCQHIANSSMFLITYGQPVSYFGAPSSVALNNPNIEENIKQPVI